MAVRSHRINHPWARHKCARVETVDPTSVIPGGRLDILVASPECTHFSVARGGKPKDDQKRASPNFVLDWLSKLYVKSVLIENVPEFQSWGPLGADGHPLKSRRGELFKAFIHAIQANDYECSYQVLNAADYGGATSRKRLFILAHRGRGLVTWPRPTHSKGGKMKGTKPWRGAREIIDWSIEGKSIFNRRRPLSPATMERIFAGLERFGGDELQPFIVKSRGTTQQQIKASASSIEEPIPTASAGGLHIGLAEPALEGLLVSAGSRDFGVRPVSEAVPSVIPKSGIAVAAPFLLSHASGGAPRSVEQPSPTQVARAAPQLVEAFLLPHQSGRPVADPDDPMPVIHGGRAPALVQPFIMQRSFTKGNGAYVRSTEEPTYTQTKRLDQALVQPILIDCLGKDRPGDISRVRTVEEPTFAQHAGGNRTGLVCAHLQSHFGEREGQAPRVHDIDDPTPTITSRGPALIEGVLVDYHGQGRPHSVAEPIGVFGTKEQFGLAKPYIQHVTHGGRVHSIDAPLATVTGAHRGEFALVQPVIGDRKLDIRFRMLKPHELSAAMGFGASYEFRGTIEERIRQIGNAVEVNIARALCGALLGVGN